MAEVTSVMLTMLHDDFKTLYRLSDEVGNEDVAPLIDECTVFPDESFPHVLHILWDDVWSIYGEGERFVEDFIRECSHHIAYVMDDRSVVEREEKIVEDDVDLGSHVMNTRILRSVIPIVTPANYAEDTYDIDWNNPMSASDAYDEPVYYYMVDDLNRG